MLRPSIAIALAALACTHAFFYEYRRPVRSMHIPYDLSGYHYSLAGYAFESVKAGRWPQWDPTTYAGMDFTANPQTALFYPGTWLMFLLSWNRDRLSYQALQDQVFIHVWVAFLLAFYWLRGRKSSPLACTLGAAVYAFSGYLCLNLQHFGLVAAYTWFPLASRGIDQAVEEDRWRPLWKVVAASALCFLGGYPPMWVVFAIVIAAYSVAQRRPWRVAPAVAAALAISLLICAVQILPTWSISGLREPEARFGSGHQDPLFYLSYVSPNYHDFSVKLPKDYHLGMDYLYLGAPGLAGLLLALPAMRRRMREALPLLAVLGTCLFFVANPFDLAQQAVAQNKLAMDLFRDWYFLAGMTPAAAGLAALGLDWFLRRPTRSNSSWLFNVLFYATIALTALWAAVEVVRWRADAFAAGPASLLDPAVTLAIFALGLFAFRSQSGTRRAIIAAVLVIGAGVDYKAFGTSKRFNAEAGQGPVYPQGRFPAMSDDALAEMQSHSVDRVLREDYGPQVYEFRFLGLSIPQGFDPFLTKQMRQFVNRHGTWDTDREFRLNPADIQAMRVLGIRYVISGAPGEHQEQLYHDPRYRFVERDYSFYRIYEAVHFEHPWAMNWPGEVTLTSWTPEHRVFTVESATGGLFTFSEQFFPGWSATIDGQPALIEPWENAFQSVPAPAGHHTIEFLYRTPYLRRGAAISLATLLVLTLLVFRRRAGSPARTGLQSRIN